MDEGGGPAAPAPHPRLEAVEGQALPAEVADSDGPSGAPTVTFGGSGSRTGGWQS